MDIKINLPPEECTCDAKVFYDKYRKQVDVFVAKELENAPASSIIVGRKAVKKVKSTTSSGSGSRKQVDAFSEKELEAPTSTISVGKKAVKKVKSTTSGESRSRKQESESVGKKAVKIVESTTSSASRSRKQDTKRILLPKIGGESESVSTTATDTRLPKIKVDKKWSEDLLYTSSSLDTTILRPSSISSVDIKEPDQHLKRPKKIKMYDSKSFPKKRIYEERKQQIVYRDQRKEAEPSSTEEDSTYSIFEDLSKEELEELEDLKEIKEMKKMAQQIQKKQVTAKDREKKFHLVPTRADKSSSSSSSSSSLEDDMPLSQYEYLTEEEIEQRALEKRHKKRKAPKLEERLSAEDEVAQYEEIKQKATKRDKQKKAHKHEERLSEDDVAQYEDTKQRTTKRDKQKIAHKHEERLSSEDDVTQNEYLADEEAKQRATKRAHKHEKRLSFEDDVAQNQYLADEEAKQRATKRAHKHKEPLSSEDDVAQYKEPKRRTTKRGHKQKKAHKHEEPLSSEYSTDEETNQRATKIIQKEKKAHKPEEPLSTEDDSSIDSYDYKTEQARTTLKLIKKKEDNFIAHLIAKAKKEGLDENFIMEILAKARETGQEEDLLRSLNVASQEGKLGALLFAMSEITQTGEFEEITSTLINEYKGKRRKSLVLELIKNFKSNQRDDNYLADLIAEAMEEDPDDELFFMLSKAVEENTLKNLISSLSQAKKKGQLDSMISILVKKGKRRQGTQLKALINNIAADIGQDNSFIENMLSKAEQSGNKDELMTRLLKAKTKGNLDEVMIVLADALPDEDPLNVLIKKVPRQKESYLTTVHSDEIFAKWLSKARRKEEEDELRSKFSEIKRRKKSAQFHNLISEMNVENIDELFSAIAEVLSDDAIDDVDDVDDVDNDDDDDVVAVVRSKKPKQIQRTHKPPRKLRKSGRDFRPPAVTTGEKKNDDKRVSFVEARNQRNSKLERIKQRILYRRQLSRASALPDVIYELIQRHKIQSPSITEPEKIDEEEDETPPEEPTKKKVSKFYRESFLKKIYGGRKIGPTPVVTSSEISSTNSSLTTKTTYAQKKPKLKKQPTTVPAEKESPPPRKMKKHIVRYAKKKSFREVKETSEDSDDSSIEVLLDKKITKICTISGEERSERGYLVGFRYKDDDHDEIVGWTKKPKKTDTWESDTGERESRARRRAEVYFNSRKIEDFFHFLGSHLVAAKPGDPIDYLISLLENCIHYRNGIGRPPLLFEHIHVESLYYSMDILNEGFITVEQYRTGMETLFIKEFTVNPTTNKNNMVLKETFIHEALKWQRIQLKNMLRGSHHNLNKISNSTLGSIYSKVDLYYDG